MSEAKQINFDNTEYVSINAVSGFATGTALEVQLQAGAVAKIIFADAKPTWGDIGGQLTQQDPNGGIKAGSKEAWVSSTSAGSIVVWES